MVLPEQVISVALAPKTKVDEAGMANALTRLAAEDKTLRVTTDVESGKTIILGVSEPHLASILERMRREFKVEVEAGVFKAAYRETIRKRVREEGKHRPTGYPAGKENLSRQERMNEMVRRKP